MARSLVEQGMDHPYVKDHVAILIGNMGYDLTPFTADLIREEVKDFLRGSMRIALLQPQQRPNMEDPQWESRWNSDTDVVVRCLASQTHIGIYVTKIDKLSPVRPISLLRHSLQNVAVTATQIVRLLACGMNPDDFIK